MSRSSFVFKGQTYTATRLAEMSRDQLMDLRNEIQAEIDSVRGTVTEMKREARATGNFSQRDRLQTFEGLQRALGRGMMLIQAACTKVNMQHKAKAIAANAEKRVFDQWRAEDKKLYHLAQLIFASSVDAKATADLESEAAVAEHRKVAQEAIYAAQTFIDVFDDWLSTEPADTEDGENDP